MVILLVELVVVLAFDHQVKILLASLPMVSELVTRKVLVEVPDYFQNYSQRMIIHFFHYLILHQYLIHFDNNLLWHSTRAKFQCLLFVNLPHLLNHSSVMILIIVVFFVLLFLIALFLEFLCDLLVRFHHFCRDFHLVRAK